MRTILSFYVKEKLLNKNQFEKNKFKKHKHLHDAMADPKTHLRRYSLSCKRQMFLL